MSGTDKVLSCLTITTFFLLFIAIGFAQSAVPPYIHYQGRLVDQATGAPINDSKSITFSLYDSETGQEAAIYYQIQEVTINEGVFSVYLGKGEGYYDGNRVADGIPSEVFTDHSARYLGIKLEESQIEMYPRQLIVSAAYAYKAERASKADYAMKAGEAENLMGQVTVSPSGNVGIGTANPGGLLDVGGGNLVVDPNSGNVGIGTENPHEKLTVMGMLCLQEQDASPSATAGYGKLYAKPVVNEEKDSYTKLLLHMDTYELTDSSPSAHLISKMGNAARSSTESKFGGYSVYFDGVSDYLSIPDSDDWDFGSGDFTIDFWIYRMQDLHDTEDYFLEARNENGYVPWYIKAVDATIGAGFTNNDLTYLNTTLPITLSYNQWHHVAVVRTSSALYLFIDGQLVDMNDGANNGKSILTFNGNLKIGYGETSGYKSFPGYMDELRITKGIARWTTNFTPPSRPYGLSGGLFYKDSSGREIEIGSASGVGTSVSLWGQGGSTIYYNGGNVGIGLANPNYKLDIQGGPGELIQLSDGLSGHALKFYGDSFTDCSSKSCTFSGQTSWMRISIGNQILYIPLFK